MLLVGLEHLTLCFEAMSALPLGWLPRSPMNSLTLPRGHSMASRFPTKWFSCCGQVSVVIGRKLTSYRAGPCHELFFGENFIILGVGMAELGYHFNGHL